MTRGVAPRARRPRTGAPLPSAFFDRPTEAVARDLLGAVLWSRTAEGVASGRIVETEAYLGPHDPACHSAAGLTERTRLLHAPAGRAYVYFTYGMHWMFNAVTREEGYGSAVLIRALEPLDGEALMQRRRGARVALRDLSNGPAKLAEALAIDARYNGVRLDRGDLRILAGPPVPDEEVLVSPRIGITKAADWPLRWFVRDNPFVSRTPRGFAVRPAGDPSPRTA
jgi:DNA-3-methyladenine glycosylase